MRRLVPSATTFGYGCPSGCDGCDVQRAASTSPSTHSWPTLSPGRGRWPCTTTATKPLGATTTVPTSEPNPAWRATVLGGSERDTTVGEHPRRGLHHVAGVDPAGHDDGRTARSDAGGAAFRGSTDRQQSGLPRSRSRVIATTGSVNPSVPRTVPGRHQSAGATSPVRSMPRAARTDRSARRTWPRQRRGPHRRLRRADVVLHESGDASSVPCTTPVERRGRGAGSERGLLGHRRPVFALRGLPHGHRRALAWRRAWACRSAGSRGRWRGRAARLPTPTVRHPSPARPPSTPRSAAAGRRRGRRRRRARRRLLVAGGPRSLQGRWILAWSHPPSVTAPRRRRRCRDEVRRW